MKYTKGRKKKGVKSTDIRHNYTVSQKKSANFETVYLKIVSKPT